MDAAALLSSQGWRGKGHSLHKTDDSIGLAKPLLLNRKDNTKGLGQKQHFTSDQWWMNAFDEQLQGLDTSKEGKVVQTVTRGKINAIEKGKTGKYSLYASFVSGGLLKGTLIGETETDDSTSSSDVDEKKPTVTATAKKSKEEGRLRKEAKRQRKAERAARRERKKAKAEKKSPVKARDQEKTMRRAKKEERRRKKEKDSKKKAS